MTEIFVENITRETEVALNTQLLEETSDFSAFKHEFNNTPIFPDLSEWSRYLAQGNERFFQGVTFKDNNHRPYVTITMDEPKTGFKNIFGKYVVDENGFMHSANILTHNTRDIAKGHKVSFLHEDTQGDLQFFLIANGHSYNKNLNSAEGDINFVYGLGTDQERVAKISDDPSQIDLIYTKDGHDDKLFGPIYHTGNAQLNFDGKAHSISGLVNDNDTNILRVGFEDFPNLGDGDFNDVMFDIEVFYLSKDTVVVHDLNGIEPASGEDEIDLKDDDELFGGGALSQGLFDSNGSQDYIVDLENKEEDKSIENLLEAGLVLEDLIQTTHSIDSAVSGFVEETDLATITAEHSAQDVTISGVAIEQDDLVIPLELI